MAPGMMASEARQPQDEWLLEQGFSANVPLLNLTSPQKAQNAKNAEDAQTTNISEPSYPHDTDGTSEDRALIFGEERPGWEGYIEWEDYPEKKEKAAAILESKVFPPPPEFQYGNLPTTNPVLEGVRWKMWHKAVGGPLTSVPEESWLRVVQEKHADMLHLLEFPYNGEPPKRLVTAKPITPNPLHFVRNHGGIPNIEPEAFELRLDGLVKNPMKLSLADLQNESLGW